MANLEATETDFPYVQPQEIVDGQLDRLAGGIMEQMENKDPNHSAKVEPAAEEPPAKEEAAAAEEETQEGEEPAEEGEKYTIKWQGQEKEVTQAELLDLAQKGFDYTQKTQALAQERDQLAPYQGLANLLKADPARAQQIAAILSGQPAQQPAAPVKKFDDPIEQLKWEIKQETIAEMRGEMARPIGDLHRLQAVERVKNEVKADPQFKEVSQILYNQVAELPGSDELFAELSKGIKYADLAKVPPSIAKDVYIRMDQDPETYLAAFAKAKRKLTATATTTPPKTVKKTTKAPFVDAGGVESPEGAIGKERAQRLSKQKAAALRTGDPMAIGKWLEESGALEHLY